MENKGQYLVNGLFYVTSNGDAGYVNTANNTGVILFDWTDVPEEALESLELLVQNEEFMDIIQMLDDYKVDYVRYP